MVKNRLPMQEMQEIWVRSLGWEDLLEEGMAAQLQYFCLENHMDRGAWQGVAKSDMTEHACIRRKTKQPITCYFWPHLWLPSSLLIMLQTHWRPACSVTALREPRLRALALLLLLPGMCFLQRSTRFLPYFPYFRSSLKCHLASEVFPNLLKDK